MFSRWVNLNYSTHQLCHPENFNTFGGTSPWFSSSSRWVLLCWRAFPSKMEWLTDCGRWWWLNTHSLISINRHQVMVEEISGTEIVEPHLNHWQDYVLVMVITILINHWMYITWFMIQIDIVRYHLVEWILKNWKNAFRPLQASTLGGAFTAAQRLLLAADFCTFRGNMFSATKKG